MATSEAIRRPPPRRAGIGLHARHQPELLASTPPVGLGEVQGERLLGAGRNGMRVLDRTRGLYPVSLHGVGLSLGSSAPLDHGLLARLRRLVDRIEPLLVSDRLDSTPPDRSPAREPDRLPTRAEALDHVVSRIQAAQESLRRQILLESTSRYLAFADSRMSSMEFLAEAVRRSGCAILLDLNDVYVNAHNLGFDAAAWLDAVPARLVAQLHLSGHSFVPIGGGDGRKSIAVDSRDRPVAAPVWTLFRHAVARFGSRPTVVEWDVNLPPLDVLVLEAARADRIASEVCRAWTA